VLRNAGSRRERYASRRIPGSTPQARKNVEGVALRALLHALAQLGGDLLALLLPLPIEGAPQLGIGPARFSWAGVSFSQNCSCSQSGRNAASASRTTPRCHHTRMSSLPLRHCCPAPLGAGHHHQVSLSVTLVRRQPQRIDRARGQHRAQRLGLAADTAPLPS
jgi:hypothetical protein